MTTTLRIETSDSGAYANASEADLHRLIMRLDSTHAHVVVRRDDGDLFAQAMFGVPKGSYAVEYSLKSGQLRRAVVDTPERAYELLAGWALDRPGWKQSAKWEHVTNDDVVDFQAGCTWLDEAGVLVVEFQPLGLRASGTNREAAMATLMLQLSDATQDKETALAFSAWCADHVVKSSELLRIRRTRETARVKGATSQAR